MSALSVYSTMFTEHLPPPPALPHTRGTSVQATGKIPGTMELVFWWRRDRFHKNKQKMSLDEMEDRNTTNVIGMGEPAEWGD